MTAPISVGDRARLKADAASPEMEVEDFNKDEVLCSWTDPENRVEHEQWFRVSDLEVLS